jgi:tRNA (guanine37-N1)-methyltransferase
MLTGEGEGTVTMEKLDERKFEQRVELLALRIPRAHVSAVTRLLRSGYLLTDPSSIQSVRDVKNRTIAES